MREKHWLMEKSRREAGFTLIELMVVLAILVLLVGLVGPRVIGIFSKAKPQVARVQLHELGAALDHFYLDVGRYPTTDEGLRALTQRPGNLSVWSGPYLNKGVPKDPWGREYAYKSPGDHGLYDIMSYGADGAPGGEAENADIANWEEER